MHRATMTMTRDEKIAFAFRNVDTKDLEWLQGVLGDGGHGRFWKTVIRELDSALRSPSQSGPTRGHD